MILFHTYLILFKRIFKYIHQLRSTLQLLNIDFGLLTCNLFVTYFLTQFVKIFEILLPKFSILLVFQSSISSKGVNSIEIGITDMVYQIFTNNVNRIRDLCLNCSKIAINSLLQHATFRFWLTLDSKLLENGANILFIEENSGSHMIMILLDTNLTARRFFPNTAVRSTEIVYFLTMFTLIHFSFYKYKSHWK